LIHLHEYARLLGYPAGKPLEGDVLARAEEALDWYRRHGKPRVVTRVVGSDRLAAAAVEHLAASLGNPRSPGHKGFPIEEQARLFALLAPPEIEILPSGMLNPKNSILAVYDPPDESVESVESVSPCSRCDWRCSFRRKAA
jgi:hypothetical protein